MAFDPDDAPQQLVDISGGTLHTQIAAPDGEPDWTKTPFPIELFENRVVIKRDRKVEITTVGLVLPQSAQVKTMTGTVVAVGPGMRKGDGTTIPLAGNPPIKVGDVVMFEKFRQMIELEIKVESEAGVTVYVYHILRDNDLLGRGPNLPAIEHTSVVQ